MEGIFEHLFTAEGLISLLTLSLLEIVLGIDNIIFIAILSSNLEDPEEQAKARRLGIIVAVVSRIVLLIVLLFVIDAVSQVTVFTIFGNALTGKDLILIIGGLFLIGKATHEIHNKLEGHEEGHGSAKAATMQAILAQIFFIDVIFSLDSVITAIGVGEDMVIMVLAVLIAAGGMILASNAIADFVERHPTMKILALAFLIAIGLLLVIEGWNPEAAHDMHLKNYAYVAMAFSVVVELMNIRLRSISKSQVKLKNSHLPKDGG